MPSIRHTTLVIFLALLTSCGTAGQQAHPNPSAGSAYPNPPAGSVYPNPLPASPPATCAVTRPPDPAFVPPPPTPPKPPARYVGQFWYGTPDLWTMLGNDGTWSGLQLGANGYSQKIFWWRQGYVATDEPNPALTVTATRLDASAPAVTAADATNASADFGDAMLMGVTLPTAGCWQITGQYRGHDLSFIVWVAP
jgi:hypothetical protein